MRGFKPLSHKKKGFTVYHWLGFRPKIKKLQATQNPSGFVWGPNRGSEQCLTKEPVKSLCKSFLVSTDAYRESSNKVLRVGWRKPGFQVTGKLEAQMHELKTIHGKRAAELRVKDLHCVWRKKKKKDIWGLEPLLLSAFRDLWSPAALVHWNVSFLSFVMISWELLPARDQGPQYFSPFVCSLLEDEENILLLQAATFSQTLSLSLINVFGSYSSAQDVWDKNWDHMLNESKVLSFTLHCKQPHRDTNNFMPPTKLDTHSGASSPSQTKTTKKSYQVSRQSMSRDSPDQD